MFSRSSRVGQTRDMLCVLCLQSLVGLEKMIYTSNQP